jgi:hypothetical protein
MAWRPSFGATVLSALVALHSSTLIDLASSEQPDKDPWKYQNALAIAMQARSMLEEMIGSGHIEVEEKMVREMQPSAWDKMLGLWQEDETSCGDDLFELLAKWRARLDDETFKGYVWMANKKWENTCYARLEERIQRELDEMSESTREHLKLFADQEHRECIDKGKSECSGFLISNSVVGALRRLIGWPEGAPSADQLEAAKRFVSACKEMTASGSIMTMRTKYRARAPWSPQPYFPHIRFYDYCRRLLDLEWSAQEIDDRLGWAACVKRLGAKLDEIRAHRLSRADPEAMSSSPASESEQKRLVAEAAVRSNKWPLFNFVRENFIESQEDRLDDLKKKCSRLLGQVDNLIWMHQHMYEPMGLERDGLQAPDTERNLRYLEACKQLGELENEEIIEMTKNSRKSSAPVERCFGCSSA